MTQISRKFDGGFTLLAVSLIGLLAGSIIGTADAQIVVRNHLIIGGQQDNNRLVIGGRDADVAQALMALQQVNGCLLYTSPSPRDATLSRMPSSA